MGHRPGVKGGYFPVPPVDSESDLRAEMLSTMGEMGVVIEKHHHEVGQSQHELGMKFGPMVQHGRPVADLQILHPQRGAQLRQDGDFHAEADLRRQRLRHALPPVDLEGGQAAVRRQWVCRPVGDGAVLHRRHHQAREGAERVHQPDDEQLQAADPRLRGAGAAGLFGAQPLRFLPHPVCDQPEGEAGGGAVPRSGLQSVSGFRGDADGGAGRHPQQDPSGRSDGQGPL